MNILVTGGSGYVGSHICVKLLTLGFKVIVIDNLINSQIKALTRVSEIVNINLNFDLKEDACFTFIKGDVCDKNPLVKIFAFCQIDAVIHLSGLKSVRESVENPVKYHSNNVDGSLNLFNIMQEFNCKTIIFSSSATVYGATKEVPISENSQLFPSNPYGVNKKSIEDILKNLYNSNNSWHIAILRFFNPIGAHKSGLIGESPLSTPNNLMPYIMKVANGEFKKLKIYGNDYDTHDGTAIRDYIHVDDLASGHIKALNVISKKPQLIIANLGTGIGYSVLDVVKAVEKVSNQRIIYQFSERRAGDAEISYSDPSYAKEILNWQVKYSLEDMCYDSWNYTLKN